MFCFWLPWGKHLFVTKLSPASYGIRGVVKVLENSLIFKFACNRPLAFLLKIGTQAFVISKPYSIPPILLSFPFAVSNPTPYIFAKVSLGC